MLGSGPEGVGQQKAHEKLPKVKQILFKGTEKSQTGEQSTQKQGKRRKGTGLNAVMPLKIKERKESGLAPGRKKALGLETKSGKRT